MPLRATCVVPYGPERLQEDIDRSIPIAAYPVAYRAELLEYFEKASLPSLRAELVVLSTRNPTNNSRRRRVGPRTCEYLPG